MEKDTNATQVPLSFVSSFIVNTAKGEVDMRKTLSNFQNAVETYIKENAELKPTIVAELQQYGHPLGEARLIQFVMHALRLPVHIESQNRIKSALQELVQAGRVVRKTNEGGGARGRGTGYQLSQ